jgi:hypoxanthine phosphoribosyltransferase
VLLDKPFRREVKVALDFVGHVLEADHFVVGYGLDDEGKKRNYPYIYAK